MADNTRALIEQTARKYAAQFKVPVNLVLAIIETESSYNPRAESSLGAQGLMQLMPHMQREYNVEDPFDIDQSIRGGVSFLKHLLDTYPDRTHAIAAYNAGEKAVNKHKGIPPYNETQTYVYNVSSLEQSLSQEQDPSMAQGPVVELKISGQTGPPRQRQEKWFYPNKDLASDAMVGNDGMPLASNDPARQGILLSYQGRGPSPAELKEVFRVIDPEGFLTREDAASLAAGATSSSGAIANLVKRILPWTKQAAKTAIGAGRFIPGVGWGLTAATGLAGYGGELWRQSQVPDEVGRFGIVSWPRSRYGMHYEGAPDTPEEAQYAAFIAGLQEAVGEGAFGAIGKGIAQVGRAWKKTGYSKPLRTGMEAATGVNVGTKLAEGGINPTRRGVKKANEAMQLGDQATDAILDAANNSLLDPDGSMLTVRLDDVFRRAGDRLKKMGGFAEAGAPQLQREFDKIAKEIVEARPTALGFDPMMLDLRKANKLRKDSNELGAVFYEGTKGGVSNPSAHVHAAIGSAFRDAMAESMEVAEKRALASVPRPASTIAGFMKRGRFAQRFKRQLGEVQQWGNAKKLADEQSRQGASGLQSGWLALGAPSTVGGILGGFPGAVAGGAVGLAAASQLSPLMRSLTGGALYRSGVGLASRLPMNITRGVEAVTSGPTSQQFKGSLRGPSPPMTNFNLTQPFFGGVYPQSLLPTTQTPNRLLRELQQQNPGLRRLPFQNTR